MDSSPETVLLFAYGTLQQENVQRACFGRTVEGIPDVLPGFVRAEIEVVDEGVIAKSGTRTHPIVMRSDKSGDEVPGTLFRITEADLAAADAYEVSDYKRISAELASGAMAWVYIKAEG